MNSQNNFTERLTSLNNVCSAEKYTKRISVLLLPLVYFSVEQTLSSQNDQYWCWWSLVLYVDVAIKSYAISP